MGLKSWFHVAQATSAWGEGPYRNKIFTGVGVTSFPLHCDSDLEERKRKKGESKEGRKKRKRKGKFLILLISDVRSL